MASSKSFLAKTIETAAGSSTAASQTTQSTVTKPAVTKTTPTKATTGSKVSEKISTGGYSASGGGSSSPIVINPVSSATAVNAVKAVGKRTAKIKLGSTAQEGTTQQDSTLPVEASTSTQDPLKLGTYTTQSGLTLHGDVILGDTQATKPVITPAWNSEFKRKDYTTTDSTKINSVEKIPRNNFNWSDASLSKGWLDPKSGAITGTYKDDGTVYYESEEKNPALDFNNWIKDLNAKAAPLFDFCENPYYTDSRMFETYEQQLASMYLDVEQTLNDWGPKYSGRIVLTATDENGNTIYETDANGEVKKDSKGQPIAVLLSQEESDALIKQSLQARMDEYKDVYEWLCKQNTRLSTYDDLNIVDPYDPKYYEGVGSFSSPKSNVDLKTVTPGDIDARIHEIEDMLDHPDKLIEAYGISGYEAKTMRAVGSFRDKDGNFVKTIPARGSGVDIAVPDSLWNEYLELTEYKSAVYAQKATLEEHNAAERGSRYYAFLPENFSLEAEQESLTEAVGKIKDTSTQEYRELTDRLAYVNAAINSNENQEIRASYELIYGYDTGLLTSLIDELQLVEVGGLTAREAHEKKLAEKQAEIDAKYEELSATSKSNQTKRAKIGQEIDELEGEYDILSKETVTPFDTFDGKALTRQVVVGFDEGKPVYETRYYVKANEADLSEDTRRRLSIARSMLAEAQQQDQISEILEWSGSANLPSVDENGRVIRDKDGNIVHDKDADGNLVTGTAAEAKYILAYSNYLEAMEKQKETISEVTSSIHTEDANNAEAQYELEVRDSRGRFFGQLSGDFYSNIDAYIALAKQWCEDNGYDYNTIYSDLAKLEESLEEDGTLRSLSAARAAVSSAAADYDKAFSLRYFSANSDPDYESYVAKGEALLNAHSHEGGLFSTIQIALKEGATHGKAEALSESLRAEGIEVSADDILVLAERFKSREYLWSDDKSVFEPSDNWTAEDLKTFNYAAGKDGIVAAAEFAFYTNMAYRSADRQNTQQYMNLIADIEWRRDSGVGLMNAAMSILKSAASTPLELIDAMRTISTYAGNLSVTGDVRDAKLSGYLGENASFTEKIGMEAAASQYAAGNWQIEWLDNLNTTLHGALWDSETSSAGQWLYGIVSSTAQSVISLATAETIGKAIGLTGEALATFSSAIVDLSFFSSSFNQTYQDALIANKGIASDEIFLTALYTGVNEALFEHISLDRLIHAPESSSVKNLIKSVLISAGIEGSEELFTDFFNNLASYGVNFDESEYYKTLEEYYNEATGRNYKDDVASGNIIGDELHRAETRASLDMLQGWAQSFVSGAISSFGSVGVKQSFSYASSVAKGKRFTTTDITSVNAEGQEVKTKADVAIAEYALSLGLFSDEAEAITAEITELQTKIDNNEFSSLNDREKARQQIQEKKQQLEAVNRQARPIQKLANEIINGKTSASGVLMLIDMLDGINEKYMNEYALKHADAFVTQKDDEGNIKSIGLDDKRYAYAWTQEMKRLYGEDYAAVAMGVANMSDAAVMTPLEETLKTTLGENATEEEIGKIRALIVSAASSSTNEGSALDEIAAACEEGGVLADPKTQIAIMQWCKAMNALYDNSVAKFKETKQRDDLSGISTKVPENFPALKEDGSNAAEVKEAFLDYIAQMATDRVKLSNFDAQAAASHRKVVPDAPINLEGRFANAPANTEGQTTTEATTEGQTQPGVIPPANQATEGQNPVTEQNTEGQTPTEGNTPAKDENQIAYEQEHTEIVRWHNYAVLDVLHEDGADTEKKLAELEAEKNRRIVALQQKYFGQGGTTSEQQSNGTPTENQRTGETVGQSNDNSQSAGQQETKDDNPYKLQTIETNDVDADYAEKAKANDDVTTAVRDQFNIGAAFEVAGFKVEFSRYGGGLVQVRVTDPDGKLVNPVTTILGTKNAAIGYAAESILGLKGKYEEAMKAKQEAEIENAKNMDWLTALDDGKSMDEVLSLYMETSDYQTVRNGLNDIIAKVQSGELKGAQEYNGYTIWVRDDGSVVINNYAVAPNADMAALYMNGPVATEFFEGMQTLEDVQKKEEAQMFGEAALGVTTGQILNGIRARFDTLVIDTIDIMSKVIPGRFAIGNYTVVFEKTTVGQYIVHVNAIDGTEGRDIDAATQDEAMTTAADTIVELSGKQGERDLTPATDGTLIEVETPEWQVAKDSGASWSDIYTKFVHSEEFQTLRNKIFNFAYGVKNSTEKLLGRIEVIDGRLYVDGKVMESVDDAALYTAGPFAGMDLAGEVSEPYFEGIINGGGEVTPGASESRAKIDEGATVTKDKNGVTTSVTSNVIVKLEDGAERVFNVAVTRIRRGVKKLLYELKILDSNGVEIQGVDNIFKDAETALDRAGDVLDYELDEPISFTENNGEENKDLQESVENNGEENKDAKEGTETKTEENTTAQEAVENKNNEATDIGEVQALNEEVKADGTKAGETTRTSATPSTGEVAAAANAAGAMMSAGELKKALTSSFDSYLEETGEIAGHQLQYNISDGGGFTVTVDGVTIQNEAGEARVFGDRSAAVSAATNAIAASTGIKASAATAGQVSSRASGTTNTASSSVESASTATTNERNAEVTAASDTNSGTAPVNATNTSKSGKSKNNNLAPATEAQKAEARIAAVQKVINNVAKAGENAVATVPAWSRENIVITPGSQPGTFNVDVTDKAGNVLHRAQTDVNVAQIAAYVYSNTDGKWLAAHARVPAEARQQANTPASESQRPVMAKVNVEEEVKRVQEKILDMRFVAERHLEAARDTRARVEESMKDLYKSFMETKNPMTGMQYRGAQVRMIQLDEDIAALEEALAAYDAYYNSAQLGMLVANISEIKAEINEKMWYKDLATRDGKQKKAMLYAAEIAERNQQIENILNEEKIYANARTALSSQSSGWDSDLASGKPISEVYGRNTAARQDLSRSEGTALGGYTIQDGRVSNRKPGTIQAGDRELVRYTDGTNILFDTTGMKSSKFEEELAKVNSAHMSEETKTMVRDAYSLGIRNIVVTSGGALYVQTANGYHHVYAATSQDTIVINSDYGATRQGRHETMHKLLEAMSEEQKEAYLKVFMETVFTGAFDFRQVTSDGVQRASISGAEVYTLFLNYLNTLYSSFSSEMSEKARAIFLAEELACDLYGRYDRTGVLAQYGVYDEIVRRASQFVNDTGLVGSAKAVRNGKPSQTVTLSDIDAYAKKYATAMGPAFGITVKSGSQIGQTPQEQVKASVANDGALFSAAEQYNKNNPNHYVRPNVMQQAAADRSEVAEYISMVRASAAVDSTGRALSDGQQNYFSLSKIRDELGRLQVWYHGTISGSTWFDKNASRDGTLWITDSPRTAESYSGTSKTESLVARGYRTSPNNLGADVWKSQVQWFYSVLRNLGVPSDYQEAKQVFAEWDAAYREKVGVSYSDAQHRDRALISYSSILSILSDLIKNPGSATLTPEEMAGNVGNPFGGKSPPVNKLKASLDEFIKRIPDDTKRSQVQSQYDLFRETLNNDYASTNQPIYVNMTNPLVIDAGGAVWNSIPFKGDDILPYATGVGYKYGTPANLSEDENGAHTWGVNTRTLAAYAQAMGYDGVVIQNVHDSGPIRPEDNLTTVAAVFDSNQVKDVDNLNPTGNVDTRYSAASDTMVIATALTNEGIIRATAERKGEALNTDEQIFLSQRATTVNAEDFTSYAYTRAEGESRTYNGEILDKAILSDATVKSLNEVGGLRLYTIGAYTPQTALSYMQMMTDAAVRGLKVTAYADDITLAQLLLPTGANINLSIDLNSEAFNEAVQLKNDNKDSGLCLVAVCKSDAETAEAFSNPNVDIVVPYHTESVEGTQLANVDSLTEYANYLINTGAKPVFEQWLTGFQEYEAAYKAHGDALADIQSKIALGQYDKSQANDATKSADDLLAEAARNFEELNKDYMKAAKATARTPANTKSVQPVFDTAAVTDAIDAQSSIVQQESDDQLADTPENTGSYSDGMKFSVAVTDKMQHALPNGQMVNTLEFLNDQIKRGEVIVTYKSFLKYVDPETGEVSLISPMASLEKDENGDSRLAHGLKYHVWEQSNGNPNDARLIPERNNKTKEIVYNPDGTIKWKFNLDKSDIKSSTVPANYNPYQHSSNEVLNDQFSIAFWRPQLITVRCIIPASEMTSGFHAEGIRTIDGSNAIVKASNPVGKMPWHKGPLASALKNTDRQVYLSRWLMPLEEVPDSEVARMYKEILDKEPKTVPVPYNVVPPNLLIELERLGVEINYKGKGVPAKGERYEYARTPEGTAERIAYVKAEAARRNAAVAENVTVDEKIDDTTIGTLDLKMSSGTIPSVTYFAGGGVLDFAIRDRVHQVLAVEWEESLREDFQRNNGACMMMSDVNAVRPGQDIKGEVLYFHASPVCKNFSRANNKAGERDEDRKFATSICGVIDAKRPIVVTVENVKGYVGSDSYNMIIDTLRKNGYDVDSHVYTASDYGAATSRERLFIRAVRGDISGLPARPKLSGYRTWWDAVSDIVDTLPEGTITETRMNRLVNVEHIDIQNLDQPLLILSGTKNGGVQHSYADEPARTLMTKGSEARIIIPTDNEQGYEVKKVTPEVFARIQGEGEYDLPRKPDGTINEKQAFKIMGNGIPAELTRAIVNPLLDLIENPELRTKYDGYWEQSSLFDNGAKYSASGVGYINTLDNLGIKDNNQYTLFNEDNNNESNYTGTAQRDGSGARRNWFEPGANRKSETRRKDYGRLDQTDAREYPLKSWTRRNSKSRGNLGEYVDVNMFAVGERYNTYVKYLESERRNRKIQEDDLKDPNISWKNKRLCEESIKSSLQTSERYQADLEKMFYDAMLNPEFAPFNPKITPFITLADYFTKEGKLAKAIKYPDASDLKGKDYGQALEEYESAQQYVAGRMAQKIANMSKSFGTNIAIVPMPNSKGVTQDMFDLAMAIKNVLPEGVNAEIFDVLEGDNRKSQYQTKKSTGKAIEAEKMGMHTTSEIPADYFPVIIDNVISTGNTAKAAYQAVGRGLVFAYALGKTKSIIDGMKDASPITYEDALDENGNVILDEKGNAKQVPVPFEKRFDPAVTGREGIKYSASDVARVGSYAAIDPSSYTEAQRRNYEYNGRRNVVGSNLKTLGGSNIHRNTKTGVGKQVGSQLYVHRDYALQAIPEDIYLKALDILDKNCPGFEFNTLMYEPKKNRIRFDEAPDFDTAREPIPGKYVIVNYEEETAKPDKSYQIWHHKWMWVKNDYKGFNVSDSWNWSKTWLSVIRPVPVSEHQFLSKGSQNGKANGSGKGTELWNDQITYFGLPTEEEDTLEYREEALFNMPGQEHASAGTSVPQVPRTFTYLRYNNTDRVLDWGAGAYSYAELALKKFYPGIGYGAVDPCNRTNSHNARVLREFMADKANKLVVNNVLNVIDSEESIDACVRDSNKYLAADGVAYFLLYNSGKRGASGGDKFQNARGIDFYLPFIEKYYSETRLLDENAVPTSRNFDKSGSFIVVAKNGEITPDDIQRTSAKQASEIIDMTTAMKAEKNPAYNVSGDRYSASDVLTPAFVNRYMKAAKEGDLLTCQDMVTETANAAGYTIEGMHGTTKIFYKFDSQFSDPEGNWGSGFYFSNSLSDVEGNYATGNGADITARIEKLTEAVIDNFDSYEEALEWARSELDGGKSVVLDSALRMTNPFVLDRGGFSSMEETSFDVEYEYDEENDEYTDMVGTLIDFVDALDDVLYDYDDIGYSRNHDEVMQRVREELTWNPDGPFQASDIEDTVRKILNESYITDEDGNSAGSEILRRTVEKLGYDGIVDANVYRKFRGMNGLHEGTIHYIVFDPSQIKLTNPITYDNDGNIIPIDDRFRTDRTGDEAWKNNDIRYSASDVSYAPVFYSKMERVIDQQMPNKMASNQIEKFLLGKGVKAEEIKWSGILPAIEGKKSVTKDELLQIARENQGDIYVEVLDNSEFGEKTKWHEKSMPGGWDYREYLYRLDGSDFTVPAMETHWGKKRTGVLAHARVQNIASINDETLLFIDEIQSDWNNAGNAHGFKDEDKDAITEEEIDEIESFLVGYFEFGVGDEETLNRIKVRAPECFNKYEATVAFDKARNSGDLAKAVSKLKNAIYAVMDPKSIDISLVTEWLYERDDYPFISNNVKDPDAAMQRIYEELDDDTISFLFEFSELLQANRKANWEYIRFLSTLDEVSAKDVQYAGKAGSYVPYVLKNLLREAAEKNYDGIAWTKGDHQSLRWSSDYGEGYEIEYDKEIPKFLNKYGKQWGAKVSTTVIDIGKAYKYAEISLDSARDIFEEAKEQLERQAADLKAAFDQGQIDEVTYNKKLKREKQNYYEAKANVTKYSDMVNGTEVWFFPVTEAMKESVLYEGQAKYSVADTYVPLTMLPRYSGNQIDEFGDPIRSRIDGSTEFGSTNVDGYYTNESTALVMLDNGDALIIDTSTNGDEGDYIKSLEGDSNAYTDTERPYIIPRADRDDNTGRGVNRPDAGLRRGQEELPQSDQTGSPGTGRVLGESGTQGEQETDRPQDLRYSVADGDFNIVQEAMRYPIASFDRFAAQTVGVGNNKRFEQVINDLYEGTLVVDEGTKRDFESMLKYIPLTEREREALIEKWVEAGEKYGIHDKGEKTNRDIRLPKSIDWGTVTSKFVQTAMENERTPQWMNDETMKQILEQDAFSYQRISDQKAMQAAEDAIKKEGYMEIKRDWDALVKSDSRVGKMDLAKGEQLLIEAMSNGNIADSMKLLTDLTFVIRGAAQTLQGARLFKQMTPLGNMYYATKIVEKLNSQYDKYFRKHPEAKRIVVPQAEAEAVMSANSREELDAAIEALKKGIAEQIPSTVADKWNAWRYLAMLGNPPTHIRNTLGNGGFVPAIAGKNMLARGLERIKVLNPNQNFTRMYGANLSKNSEFMKFANERYEVEKEIIKGNAVGNKFTDINDVMEYRHVFGKSAIGLKLEEINRFNNKLLNDEDAIFLKFHYTRALAEYLQANGVTEDDLRNGFGADKESAKLLGKAQAWAIREAQRNTYRDACKAAVVLNQLKHSGSAMGVLMEGVMPFTSTPINVLRRGIDYSPIGLINSIAGKNGLIENIKAGMDTNEAIDRLAAGLTGTGIMVLGALLARLGVIVGAGPDDDSEKKQWELEGHQAYSLELGGVSYTLDWLAPFALPLFSGVAMLDAYEKTLDEEKAFKIDDISDVFWEIMNPMTSMSMLSGISDLLNNVANAEGSAKLGTLASSALYSYFGQAFPTIFGQATRLFQDSRKMTYVDKNSWMSSDMQRFLQKAMGKLGPADTRENYVDARGEEEKTGNFLARLASNFLSPGYYSLINSTPVDDELKMISQETGETDILSNPVKKYITVKDGEGGSETRQLTAEEWSTYQTVYGKTRYDLLGEIFTDELYQSLDYTTRREVVKKAELYIDDLAQAAVFDDATNNWETWNEAATAFGADKYIILSVTGITDEKGIPDATGEELYAAAISNPYLTDTQRAMLICESYQPSKTMHDPSNEGYVYNLDASQRDKKEQIFSDLYVPAFEELAQQDYYINASEDEQMLYAEDLRAAVETQTVSQMAGWLNANGVSSSVGKSTIVSGFSNTVDVMLGAYNFDATASADYVYKEYAPHGTIDDPTRPGYTIELDSVQDSKLESMYHSILNQEFNDLYASSEYNATTDTDYQNRMVQQTIRKAQDEAVAEYVSTLGGNYTATLAEKPTGYTWGEAYDIVSNSGLSVKEQAAWIGQLASGGRKITLPNDKTQQVELTSAQQYERDRRFDEAWTAVYESKTKDPLFINSNQDQHRRELSVAADKLMDEVNAAYVQELIANGVTTSTRKDYDDINYENLYPLLAKEYVSGNMTIDEIAGALVDKYGGVQQLNSNYTNLESKGYTIGYYSDYTYTNLGAAIGGKRTVSDVANALEKFHKDGASAYARGMLPKSYSGFNVKNNTKDVNTRTSSKQPNSITYEGYKPGGTQTTVSEPTIDNYSNNFQRLSDGRTVYVLQPRDRLNLG